MSAANMKETTWSVKPFFFVPQEVEANQENYPHYFYLKY